MDQQENNQTKKIMFHSRPDRADMPIHIPITRCPPKGIGPLIILSSDVIGCHLHYWRGRSTPCQGENCEACADGQIPRWRGYLIVMNPKGDEKIMMEITAAAVPPIDVYFSEHGTLRNALLYLKRVGMKPNGKLLSKIETSARTLASLPAEPNLSNLLLRMWGMNTAEKNSPEIQRKIRGDRLKQSDFEEERSSLNNGHC